MCTNFEQPLQYNMTLPLAVTISVREGASTGLPTRNEGSKDEGVSIFQKFVDVAASLTLPMEGHETPPTLIPDNRRSSHLNAYNANVMELPVKCQLWRWNPKSQRR